MGLFRRGETMRLVGVAAGVCAVVLALAGCSESVDGQAEVSGAPLTKEQLFDPCNVPDEVLLAAGADPASKDDNPFSAPSSSWKGCGWRAGDFFVDLFSTTHTMEEFRENTLFHDFQEVTTAGRQGTQYLVGDKAPPTECGIAWESSQGRIAIHAAKASSSDSTADPCLVAKDAAPHFVEVLPK
ncbi:DUF3558 domain-containing protein [Nocardia mangyaensis]|uniref:DUF3558 domain-containing protein n=1 Tax=Nocardia mangyaensis TaxID=2213200 RepID=UPI0026749BBB|nr:DUF3558 domain-containing protein [Nocardia mangyaensis]MDO3651274.1 DUF3558 domain-containing protein [Nocardia mangyaensis]